LIRRRWSLLLTDNPSPSFGLRRGKLITDNRPLPRESDHGYAIVDFELVVTADLSGVGD
jgi:hypothetical protein